MMAPYEGPRHTVVAFELRGGTARFARSGPDEVAAPAEDVVFEIASITKVFTAILLHLLAEGGRIDLRAPLRAMSDELRHVPDWITPERLASHTSGLPNIHVPLWRALVEPRPEGRHAGVSRGDLLTWLRGWRGTDPGPRRRHAYSNLGFGLLGEAMAIREGRPFGDLLAARVLRPLGLEDTGACLDEDQSRRFAPPRNTRGDPVPAWTFDALAGAGCLRSTARDLARFSSRAVTALSAPETALDRAIARSAEPILGLGRRGRPNPPAQCSGWMRASPGRGAAPILHAAGGTAGSTCALYVCPESEAALGVLSNNGVAANLWAGARLGWSDPLRRARALFAEP
jgi:CubicO group peptidase (beta-lactamase class C family)